MSQISWPLDGPDWSILRVSESIARKLLWVQALMTPVLYTIPFIANRLAKNELLCFQNIYKKQSIDETDRFRFIETLRFARSFAPTIESAHFHQNKTGRMFPSDRPNDMS